MSFVLETYKLVGLSQFTKIKQGQLSFLMNHHNLSRPLSRCLTSFGESRSGDFSEGYNSLEERIMINNHNTSAQNNKVAFMFLLEIIVRSLQMYEIIIDK